MKKKAVLKLEHILYIIVIIIIILLIALLIKGVGG